MKNTYLNKPSTALKRHSIKSHKGLYIFHAIFSIVWYIFILTLGIISTLRVISKEGIIECVVALSCIILYCGFNIITGINILRKKAKYQKETLDQFILTIFVGVVIIIFSLFSREYYMAIGLFIYYSLKLLFIKHIINTYKKEI